MDIFWNYTIQTSREGRIVFFPALAARTQFLSFCTTKKKLEKKDEDCSLFKVMMALALLIF